MATMPKEVMRVFYRGFLECLEYIDSVPTYKESESGLKRYTMLNHKLGRVMSMYEYPSIRFDQKYFIDAMPNTGRLFKKWSLYHVAESVYRRDAVYFSYLLTSPNDMIRIVGDLSRLELMQAIRYYNLGIFSSKAKRMKLKKLRALVFERMAEKCQDRELLERYISETTSNGSSKRAKKRRKRN